MITIHSGQFTDRNDDDIKVTFYKNVPYIDYIKPEMEDETYNVNSGQKVNFSSLFKTNSQIQVENSQYIQSSDNDSITLIHNNQPICIEFTLTFYVEDDEKTVTFNMTPADRPMYDKTPYVRSDGHQMLMPVAVSQTTGFNTVLGSPNSEISNYVIVPENNPVRNFRNIAGDKLIVYPDTELKVNGRDNINVWYILSKCMAPADDDYHPQETIVGGIGVDVEEDTIGDRVVPVEIRTLNYNRDLCSSAFTSGYMYNAPYNGGTDRLQILSTVQEEIADYNIDLIDLGYGTDWVTHYPQNIAWENFEVSSNTVNTKRYAGVRMTNKQLPNKWCEVMIAQDALHNLFTTEDYIRFTGTGGTKTFDIYSTTGQAELVIPELDWLNVTMTSQRLYHGYYRRTYRVQATSSSSEPMRTATLTAKIEGVDPSVISKEITIVQ